MATFERRAGKKGVTWRVRVRRLGGPWLTKSFPRKLDAEAWARSIETKLDSGESVPNSEARKRTVADAIDRYLEVTLPRAKHRKNADEQARLLKWWRDELGARPLVGLTTSMVAEARDALALRVSRSGKPISGATVNRYLTALSTVLGVAAREYGWIGKNPVPGVTRFQDSKGRERFLSVDERANLLSHCAASRYAALLPIVQLALAMGARKGELLSLLWSGVDFDRRLARFIDTKNGESRTVPLAPVAVEALRKWGRSRVRAGLVFPINENQLDNAWQLARDAAGLADVRFHDLRHTAASYLAMSGSSMLDIAAILGHKTLVMVKRYSHLSEQHTTEAIDRMAAKFLA